MRKHTRDAMRQKAEQGYVTGGKMFGYDNVRIAKGAATRVPNEAEAAVVRDIYTRFADGDGLRTIAAALNRSGCASPRAQQGRPHGWSSSSVRAVLERPLYRGEMVYGRTAKAYGRELGKAVGEREKGQIPQARGDVDRAVDVPDAAHRRCRPGRRVSMRGARTCAARYWRRVAKRKAARRRTRARQVPALGRHADLPDVRRALRGAEVAVEAGRRLRLRHTTTQARRLHEHAGAADGDTDERCSTWSRARCLARGSSKNCWRSSTVASGPRPRS